jgi:hypothetical protein
MKLERNKSYETRKCMCDDWSWVESRLYQIFWELVGLEGGPLSPVSTTEELLDRKVAAPI